MTEPLRKLLIMQSDDELSETWIKAFEFESDYSDVIFYDIYKTKGLDYLHQLIQRKVIEESINIILLDVSQPIVDPLRIYEIIQENSVYFACLGIDDEFKLDWISSSYASFSDLYLSSDHVAVERLKQAGVNAHFLPLPVEIPKAFKSLNKELGVTFVGQIASYKGNRQASKDFLDKNKVSVEWYPEKNGKDFKFIPRDEMNWIFKNSRINLNFSGISSIMASDNPLQTRIRTTKLRPFEILSSGGFCISEYSTTLALCFEDGKEIVFYKDLNDLLKKIEFFLEKPELAKEISERGLEKVKENFTQIETGKKFNFLLKEGYHRRSKNLFNEKLHPAISRSFYKSYIEMSVLRLLKTTTNFEFSLFFIEAKYLVYSLSKFNEGKKRYFQVLVDTLISIFKAFKTFLRELI